MNMLKDSSEIHEAVTLLSDLIDQAAIVTPYHHKLPVSTIPQYTDVQKSRASKYATTIDSERSVYVTPDTKSEAPLFRGDLLEHTIVAMCKRGGFKGAVVADSDGLSLAVFNSPVDDDALAAFTVVLGEALEKAGKVLNQQEANFISMDINYTDKVALRRFLLDDENPFYMMVICRQEIDEKDEVELSIDQIKTILKGKFEKHKKPTHVDGGHQEMDTEAVAGLLHNFSIFKSLSSDDLRTFVTFLKLRKYSEGEIIVNKGEPGTNLFIIVSGRAEVLDEEGGSLAFLGAEEVFGEMSLLSGEPVGATVKMAKAGIVLYLNGKNFRKVLGMFPSLQMYFARLLARRLTQTNIVRAQETKSGMIGTLSDMPPSELFQTFNINQKTGVLNLNLSDGSAQIYFRDGELIKADHRDKKDKEAFYEILKEKKGRFQFRTGLPEEVKNTPEIGNFMWLMMEGLRRADETQGEVA